MYYVNMTDKFMSGWGLARRRSIYCVACETLAQAKAIASAAHERSEMKYVRVASRPRRLGYGDHRTIVKFEEMGGSWLKYA